MYFEKMPGHCRIYLTLSSFLFCLTATTLTGCISREASTPPLTNYLTTIPPFAAILGDIVGEEAEVISLLPPGSSPHAYEPRPSDVRAAATSRALFFGSPGLDEWATDLDIPERIALMDLVPESLHLALDETAGGHSVSGIDPHFWMDPLTVRALLPALTDTLCALDIDSCSMYRSNAQIFTMKLDSLNDYIISQLEPVQKRVILLAEPFLLYYMHRYGLPLGGVVEAIPGKEPTLRHLQSLVGVARQEKGTVIFTQSQLPARSSRAVAEAAGVPVVELDPLGGNSGRSTYTELLLYNTVLIREALK